MCAAGSQTSWYAAGCTVSAGVNGGGSVHRLCVCADGGEGTVLLVLDGGVRRFGLLGDSVSSREAEAICSQAVSVVMYV